MTGLVWSGLVGLARGGRVLIADEMGVGKTLQAIRGFSEWSTQWD
jgi:hypothetical protein